MWAGGGYSDGYYGGGYGGGYVTSAPVLVGRPPVSAPVGYPVYGFGRDYIGWRPYPGPSGRLQLPPARSPAGPLRTTL